MVKPEWGTKRTCPKCATRFYDLEKDDPVTCINCGTQWEPEPILKSKQPLPFEQAKPENKDRLAAQNFDLLFTKPDDLDTFLKAEMSKWGRIIKEAGIQAD